MTPEETQPAAGAATGHMRGDRIQTQGQGQDLTTAFQEEENAIHGSDMGGRHRFGGRNALNSLLMASISLGSKEPRSGKMDMDRESEARGERRGKTVFCRVGKGLPTGKRI